MADSQRARLWLSRMEEVGHNDHTVLGIIYIPHHPPKKSNIQRMIGEVSNFTSLLFSVACTLFTKSNFQVEIEAELLGLNALLGALAAEADYVAAEQLLKDLAKMPGGQTFLVK